MCIIIAKDKYGRLPNEEELKNSFEYNSDGAGFMYVKDGKVVIDKGYMTYDAFLKHYKSLLEEFNNFKGKSLVMHFRIGTSGKNIKENTHPFPISSDTRKLRAKHLSQEDIGIAHNGIIKGYGTATGLNDTQEFISKYIYPIYSHFKEFYKNKDIMYGIEVITSSKWVILDKEDNLYYIGDFIEDKGLRFSNNSYTYQPFDYSKYYGEEYWHKKDLDYWYDKLYQEQQEQQEKEHEEEYLMQLESGWYVDLYGNGEVRNVGEKEYYLDYETLELLEWVDGDFKVIAVNPLIYDENYEEIW